MNAARAWRWAAVVCASLAGTAALGAIAFLCLVMPWLAALPAALMAWVWHRTRSWVPVAAGLLWAAYLPYEYAMYLRILCSGECNIRVDLLLIFPLLMLASLPALGLLFRSIWLRSEPAGPR